jgi:3-phosphoshikimate 1-carboxyvinyltransferase
LELGIWSFKKMPLPDLIEIVPLTRPVRAEITVPGSKSITNRALILAALADGEVTLKGALWSEDTQIMVECLVELGFLVNVAPDPDELCNRTITVMGRNGLVPPGGTESEPLDLFVGNAGTAARFLAPFLCLGSGVYRLHGVPRMHERPQAALFEALRELGYCIEADNHNEKLPARIYAGDLGPGGETQTEFNLRRSTPAPPKKCRVSIAHSSQFASALLLSAGIAKWEIEIVGENADESPYVSLTKGMMVAFEQFRNFTYPVEPDASSSSYFKAAGWLLAAHRINSDKVVRVNEPPGARLLQLDIFFSNFFRTANYIGWVDDSIKTSKVTKISRLSDLADSIMTAIVMTPFADREIQFTDLGRLRVQECERVIALRTELTKCGARVEEEGDTLTVYPSRLSDLHGAEIETYNDHRMAMCFAILGLKVPGIKIKNPACVKKTFPNFFQKLAAPPPYGLGVEIWEIKHGQRTRLLDGNDLFAD